VADELDFELLLHAAMPAAARITAVRALTPLSDPLMLSPIYESGCVGALSATARVASACRNVALLNIPRNVLPYSGRVHHMETNMNKVWKFDPFL
jgi:hypothetical protein